MTEFNQKTFARVVRNKGVEEKIKIGKEQVNQLHPYLISDKHFDDFYKIYKKHFTLSRKRETQQ